MYSETGTYTGGRRTVAERADYRARKRYTPRMRSTSVVCLTLIWLAGCGRPKIVEFPEGLDPLPDAVPACPTDRSESIVVDNERTDTYFAARGCGYVAADLAATAAAIQVPEVGVDRRSVVFDDCTVTEDVEPEYDVSYAVDTIVHDVVDVEYTLTWRHGQVDDSTWATHWLMTVTSPYVSYIEGSVIQTEDDDATRLEMVEHIDAMLDDKEEVIVQFLSDFHASIVATAHADALPEWPIE